MKYLACSLCVLLAALPLTPTQARASLPTAPTPDAMVPLSFAIAPGCQFKPGCAGQRQPAQRDFSYVAAPGQTINDWVAVINPSKAAPVGVTLAVADGLTPPRGAGIVYTTERQSVVGQWVGLSASAVKVPPYYIQLVPLTLHVPASARPGEYQGAIVGTSVQEAFVTQGKMRYAIHGSKRVPVLLRVTGRATAGLRISNAGLIGPSTRAVFTMTLRNTGAVIDYPAATTITLVGTRQTYTLHPAIGAITAGAATTVTLPIGAALAPGTYRLSVDLAYNARIGAGVPSRQAHARWAGAIAVR